jgi:hypothetical protein
MAAYFQVDAYAPVEEEPAEGTDPLSDEGVAPADVNLPQEDNSLLPTPTPTAETP